MTGLSSSVTSRASRFNESNCLSNLPKQIGSIATFCGSLGKRRQENGAVKFLCLRDAAAKRASDPLGNPRHTGRINCPGTPLAQ